MLKDYLLDWCQDEIDGSITGCCSKYCDNQEHCEHDCDRCLDQVHWYPSKPGRADYTCSNLLLRYLHTTQSGLLTGLKRGMFWFAIQ